MDEEWPVMRWPVNSSVMNSPPYLNLTWIMPSSTSTTWIMPECLLLLLLYMDHGCLAVFCTFYLPTRPLFCVWKMVESHLQIYNLNKQVILCQVISKRNTPKKYHFGDVQTFSHCRMEDMSNICSSLGSFRCNMGIYWFFFASSGSLWDSKSCPKLLPKFLIRRHKRWKRHAKGIKH